MPIISAMIESPNARIQDLIIRQIPEIYTQIDYSIIKGVHYSFLLLYIFTKSSNVLN